MPDSPTPEARFQVYLTQAAEAGRTRRCRPPTRRERWQANAGFVALLALGWGAVVLYVWWRG